jgi:uncharacterized membrane protein
MRSPTALGHLVFALYPALIFAGLQFLDARTVGACVLVALLARYRGQAGRLVSGFSAGQFMALALPPLLGLAVVATNSETLLRLYPASISLSMLILFGVTLIRPPSMVERFARLEQPELSPARVRYTRHVTEIWCLFFVANGAIAAYSAFASRETWALYNGLIAYLLMGTLFAGERLFRRRLMPIAR